MPTEEKVRMRERMRVNNLIVIYLFMKIFFQDTVIGIDKFNSHDIIFVFGFPDFTVTSPKNLIHTWWIMLTSYPFYYLISQSTAFIASVSKTQMISSPSHNISGTRSAAYQQPKIPPAFFNSSNIRSTFKHLFPQIILS